MLRPSYEVGPSTRDSYWICEIHTAPFILPTSAVTDSRDEEHVVGAIYPCQVIQLPRRTRLAYEEAEDRAYESSDSLEEQQHNRPESALAETESFVSCSNSQQTSQSRTRATHATNSDADDLHLSQSMQGMSINQRNELDSTYASYEDLAERSPGRQRHNQQAQQVVAICGYEPPGADGYMRMQYGDMFELVESLEYWWLLRCPRTGTVGYVPGDYVALC